jgi:hypothetical protein
VLGSMSDGSYSGAESSSGEEEEEEAKSDFEVEHSQMQKNRGAFLKWIEQVIWNLNLNFEFAVSWFL